MRQYRIPPPARLGAASGAGSVSVERWLCGLAATYDLWPRAEYTFRLPDIGRPVYVDHHEERVVSSGMADASVGVARRFAEIDGLRVVVLLEITSPSVLWDVAEGRRNGLSISAHMDEPPGGGPEWVYIAEVSLTATPRDPRARVVSTGQLALRDWEVLTGEVVPAR